MEENTNALVNKFKGTFLKVAITNVHANDWNPKEAIEDNSDNKRRYEEIKKGIVEMSLYAPIIVRELGLDDYQIIDGFHRWKACTELGYTEIIIWNLGQMSKEEAQAITLKSIYQNIPASEPLTAQVVAAINITAPEKLKLLPFSDVQIKEYLDLAHFNFDEFTDQNPGKGKETGAEEGKMVECPQCHHKFTVNLWANITENPTQTTSEENLADQPVTQNPDQVVN